MPPPIPELFVMVELMIVNVAPGQLKMPPPSNRAWLPLIVELIMVSGPGPFEMPPPSLVAELPLMVQPMMVAGPPLLIPPPRAPMPLPLTVELVSVSIPPLAMLPDALKRQSVMVAIPVLPIPSKLWLLSKVDSPSVNVPELPMMARAPMPELPLKAELVTTNVPELQM